MNLKQILATTLFSSVALAAAAQQVTISPLPQSIAWGEKAFDRQTAFNVVGAETADADAVNALTAKYEATGGSIELIIGERGDAAVAEFEMSIPSKAEGYYLQVTPGRVLTCPSKFLDRFTQANRKDVVNRSQLLGLDRKSVV